MREPKHFQCSGTRRSSFRGQRIGTEAQADQYCLAAWASIMRTLSIESASGSSSLNFSIAVAATAFCSMSRTSVDWPSSFCRMIAFDMRSAVPLAKARDWARRKRASDGAEGPQTTSGFPRLSNIRKLASCELSQWSASRLTYPSLPMQTNLRSPWCTRGSRIVQRSSAIPQEQKRCPRSTRTWMPNPWRTRMPCLPIARRFARVWEAAKGASISYGG